MRSAKFHVRSIFKCWQCRASDTPPVVPPALVGAGEPLRLWAVALVGGAIFIQGEQGEDRPDHPLSERKSVS